MTDIFISLVNKLLRA